MSSFAGNCYWCGKPVMHKTFFGTLHLCLTAEEKEIASQIRQQQVYSSDAAKVLSSIRNATKPYGGGK